MKRIFPIIIIFLFLGIISISGCINTNKVNNTFGEKKISLNLIQIANNTTAKHDEYNGTTYYYIDGYLVNRNPYDALNVKLKATTYDSNGYIVAVNDTPYLEPKNIPTKGNSEFYFYFTDNNKKIVRYKLEVMSAKALY